ncbi:PREDICTED: uncharacterized protein LOC106809612 [Priapulus caudatus]|uniref:Uncharacterized protein LOC106809612 n=1 Tax=Priapulus caudatus TaxID=37621 RepID=A0ABM1E7S4_PRICU|nr:PREDICTED: uncharacterized protein LOC106809612 [Priapulus caudatus]
MNSSLLLTLLLGYVGLIRAQGGMTGYGPQVIQGYARRVGSHRLTGRGFTSGVQNDGFTSGVQNGGFASGVQNGGFASGLQNGGFASGLQNGGFASGLQNGGFASRSQNVGFAASSALRGSAIDINNFANIDASAFGFRNFAPEYVSIADFDFGAARQAAAAFAPEEAINAASQEQVVIGRRFRSGSARQTETSSASREGSGSGEAGIELSAERTASQDATQQFSQTASGDGSTKQGAGYAFERGNDGSVRFQPVRLDSLPVHSGPRSQLPVAARTGGGLNPLGALGARGFVRRRTGARTTA